MKKNSFVFLMIFLFLASTAPAFPAQEGTPPQNEGKNLSAGFNIIDWELGSAEAIRFGQVSSIRRASGDFLAVYFLSNEFRAGRKAGTKPAVFDGDYFLISNFDAPPPNALGGNFGVFQRAPSSAQIELQTGAEGRGSLVVTATKEAEGYCGAWIQLIETSGEPLTREFLNAESFSHLVFWIKGDASNPQVDVKLADATWFKRDDSVSVGPLSSFVPSKKIDASWQLASVPLAGLPAGLDRRTLAVLAIELTSPGAHRLEIKGLGLAREGTTLPETPLKSHPLSRATWVWNTDEILASRMERNALLAHLADQGMNLVYLNLPYKFGAFVLDEAGMAELITLLNQKGIRTEVLFGDKELALPRNHAFVKNAIKDVIAYNSRVAAPARFLGVHLDIEPYLLHGFNGRRQSEFLNNYVLILSEAAGLARSAKLEFGVDIPPWFDLFNELSGDLLTATLDGKAKPIYEHVIDICDQVTLMDYRTSASGVNGTVSLAVGELAYAAKCGKKIYVGLETGPIEDERLFTFRGAPATSPFEFPNAPFFACVTGTGEDLTITILEAAEAADFQRRLREEGPSGQVELWWPVYSAPFVSGASISFATLGPEPLKQTAGLTSNELSVYPSFAGIAVHDYVNHRQLLSSVKKER